MADCWPFQPHEVRRVTAADDCQKRNCIVICCGKLALCQHLLRSVFNVGSDTRSSFPPLVGLLRARTVWLYHERTLQRGCEESS